MATFDTSSLNFDKLLDDEGDQVTHPDPSEHVSRIKTESAKSNKTTSTTCKSSQTSPLQHQVTK